MNKGAINYIIRVFLQRAIGLLFYLLGAWWTLSLRAGIYFIVYFSMTIISCIVMFHVNQTTLSERGKINTNSPKWDKLLLFVFWILSFFIIYFVAGLEAKSAPSIGIIFFIGIALQIFASFLALCAMTVNTFLESTARVQTDRGQTVCKAGPYSVVRHPTYTSILILCLSISMSFQTPFVALFALLIAFIIIIRTYLEDSMLRENLIGYVEYTKEVKYRLIPFIW